MRTAVLLVLLISCVAWEANAYGEADSNGSPVWQERANHVLVNAVRMNPSAYRSSYMAGSSPDPSSILTSYPAVAPVYLSPQLDASASNHTWDMINSGKFQHDSSDGTPCFTRVKSFYTCSGTMGENIAAGYADPLATNNQWLCDSTGSACAADKSGSDGHRSNIMGSGYKVIGVGFGSKSGTAYTNYWTQDFGGAPCSPVPTTPIYGGSHIYAGSGNTNIKFLASYYVSTAAAPSSAQVVIEGTAYDLTYELGMAQGQGIYSLSQANPKACKNYYFQFTNAAGTYRYPESGSLVTYLAGTCTTSYNSASGSSTSAPSTSAPTTSAPTSSAPTAASTTRAPTTSAPTTSVPTTNAPTTSAPTTNTPTTSAPSTTRQPWTTNAPTTTRAASTNAPTTTRGASTTRQQSTSTRWSWSTRPQA